MKIFNAKKAIIETEKLRNYVLSPTHPTGRFKAAFFRELGYSVENWNVFEQHLREQILLLNAVKVEESGYGQKFVIEGPMTGPTGKTVQVVTVWVILKGESFPRFITAYPKG